MAKLVGAANIPFVLLQLPKIVLNARNLLAGNKKSVFFATPWLVRPPIRISNFTCSLSLTPVLMDLIARFRECSLGCWQPLAPLLFHQEGDGGCHQLIVYTLGVIFSFTYTVLAQLAMVESILVPQFVATSVVVVVGLILNFLDYFGWHPGISGCCGRISSQ
jgi:hypothetical protein